MKILNTKGGSLLRMSIVAALFAMGGNAQASSFIIGNIAFAGGVTPVNASNNPTTLAVATGLNFSSHTTLTTGASDPIAVTGGNVGLQTNFNNNTTVATVSNFQFSPHLSIPFTLWTASNGGQTVSYVVTSESTFLHYPTLAFIQGFGYYEQAGQTNTVASYTINYSTAPGGTEYSGSIQNFGTVPPVAPTPLPAALFFVAPALAGVFGFSRRKNGSKLAA